MNKVIIITGTRKGIGNELALYYLKKKYIVIGCSRKPSLIKNPDYNHYLLDVSDEPCVISMIKDIYKRFGRIDALINNAGQASMNHLIFTPYATVKQIFETNFFGTFILCREVSKIMIKQKEGRIINFTTIASPLSLEGEAVYASSKSAVECFTRIAAKELAEFNITVNAIGPTPVKTDLIKNIPENKINELIKKQSIKRLASFPDIINVTDFFLSKKSSFITGQIIYLGGIN